MRSWWPTRAASRCSCREGSATDIVQEAIVRPLNAKLGRDCFALAGATGAGGDDRLRAGLRHAGDAHPAGDRRTGRLALRARHGRQGARQTGRTAAQFGLRAGCRGIAPGGARLPGVAPGGAMAGRAVRPGGRGMAGISRPAARPQLSFASPKKSRQRKGDPYCLRPRRCAAGQPASDGYSRGSAQTRYAQTRAALSRPPPCSAGAYRRAGANYLGVRSTSAREAPLAVPAIPPQKAGERTDACLSVASLRPSPPRWGNRRDTRRRRVTDSGVAFLLVYFLWRPKESNSPAGATASTP